MPSLPPWGGSGLKSRETLVRVHIKYVSLLGEGVDWNWPKMNTSTNSAVSLLGEGVDWNEIINAISKCDVVSLLGEGVDWNSLVGRFNDLQIDVSLLGEGVDWNDTLQDTAEKLLESPSLGREWIEILSRWTIWHQTSCLPPWGGSGLK